MRTGLFERSRAAGWLLAWLIAALALGMLPDPAAAQNISYDLSTTSVLRIKLPQSQSVTVVMSEAVGQLVVADPKIADAQPVTDQSLYIVGVALGRTTINLFSAKNRAPVGLIEVEVSVDTADISRAIRAVVPGSKVEVGTANGRVRLSGTVPDANSMAKVLMVAGQYTTEPIVNTITLADVQQVNLEVRILEASRNAGRELGVNWNWGNGINANQANLGPGNPSGVIGNQVLRDDGNGVFGPTVDGTARTFATFITTIISGGTGFNLYAVINALESKGLVRTLAEPNLTTMSGQEARFLAGGEVPIRVAGADGVTLQYKEFGVRLRFVPVVLGDDRIQMRLSPEVSEVTRFTATGDPVFSTRNLDSVIELRDGQSFAVAGLLQATNRKVQNQLPWVGDIPVLGALFRSSSFQKEETELVVIVTPRLVRPSTPGMVAETPLDRTATSNDPEFFLLGQLEVTKKMVRRYETGEGIVGPFGHIIDLEP
ncbi:MAG TPA: type II and III secretion system protein family protein [Devosia sp.]